MSLLRNAVRSYLHFNSLRPNHALAQVLLRHPHAQLFSTDATQPPPPSPQNPSTPSPVYGKLFGIKNLTLKSDILNLLDGCRLTPEDIKVSYSRLTPVGMFIRFPSGSAYNNAIKVITKTGRPIRLEKADPAQWEILMPYDGKTVLLQGIPQNAITEDVERFLSGCEFDPNSIKMFLRQDNDKPDPIRVAMVRFHTPIGAMNAFITRNRGFCLNNQILVRVLQ